MAVKVKKINEEGKEIIKEIDGSLASSYIAIGWEIVKEKKASIINPKEPIVKEDKNDKNL